MESQPHSQSAGMLKHLLATLLLVAATIGSFPPVLNAEFLNYDDPKFVSENIPLSEGLGWRSAGWAFGAGFFTFSPEVEYWGPLVALSRLMDVSLHGDDANGHHLTSLAIHAVNVLLVYALFFNIGGSRWRSVVGALLFGLHPLNAEVMGWLSARKDLLAGSFILLTALAYVHYCKRPGGRRYFILLATYALAAMTKPAVMVVPALLLAMDFWPMARTARWRRLVLEKIPLVAIAVLVAVLACIAQRGFGAFQTLEAIPLHLRGAHSVVNCGLYLRQWIAPHSLSIYYPIPAALGARDLILAVCVFAVFSGLAVMLRRKFPSLLGGWLWFLLGLAPVIGLVSLGSSRLADRYMYMPMLGLISAILFLPWERWISKMQLRILGATCCALLLGAFAFLSHRQAKLWHDSATLFTHAVALSPNSIPMNLQLANGLLVQGRHAEAMPVCLHGLRLAEDNPRMWRVLAATLGKSGHTAEAIRAMDKAISLDSSLAIFHVERGELFAQSGDLERALKEMMQAVEMAPGNPRCYKGRALVFAQMKRWPEAQADGRAMLDLWPHNAGYVVDVCRLLHQSGSGPQALQLLSAKRAVIERSGRAISEARVLVGQIRGGT